MIYFFGKISDFFYRKFQNCHLIIFLSNDNLLQSNFHRITEKKIKKTPFSQGNVRVSKSIDENLVYSGIL